MATKKLTKTGWTAYMYSHGYGWNFRRTVWQDEDGNRYVKINGDLLDINEARRTADAFQMDN